MRIENKYITKVQIPVSLLDNVKTQQNNELGGRPLSDIMLDYIQGQYNNLGQAYEAFSDELNRRVYEAISQYQPPSSPVSWDSISIERFQELVDYIGDLRY